MDASSSRPDKKPLDERAEEAHRKELDKEVKVKQKEQAKDDVTNTRDAGDWALI